jgi:hypothetical protein
VPEPHVDLSSSVDDGIQMTRLGLGISFISCPRAYESEWWLWDTNLGRGDVDELRADHVAYYGTTKEESRR